jgi:hypothetical protein
MHSKLVADACRTALHRGHRRLGVGADQCRAPVAPRTGLPRVHAVRAVGGSPAQRFRPVKGTRTEGSSTLKGPSERTGSRSRHRLTDSMGSRNTKPCRYCWLSFSRSLRDASRPAVESTLHTSYAPRAMSCGRSIARIQRTNRAVTRLPGRDPFEVTGNGRADRAYNGDNP